MAAYRPALSERSKQPNVDVCFSNGEGEKQVLTSAVSRTVDAEGEVSPEARVP
jgi:hypothetical protein